MLVLFLFRLENSNLRRLQCVEWSWLAINSGYDSMKGGKLIRKFQRLKLVFEEEEEMAIGNHFYCLQASVS